MVYFYSNKFALIMLAALEEVMGKKGLNAILKLAHLPHIIDNYPPSNLAKEFDFSDVSAINQALEEMYGPRGGRGLALRAGRATFDDALKNFGALAGAGDLAFKILPLQVKMKIGLPAMAKIFTQVSDQHSTVEERDQEFIYTIHRCPVTTEDVSPSGMAIFLPAPLKKGSRVQVLIRVDGFEATATVIDARPMGPNMHRIRMRFKGSKVYDRTASRRKYIYDPSSSSWVGYVENATYYNRKHEPHGKQEGNKVISLDGGKDLLVKRGDSYYDLRGNFLGRLI